MQIIYLVSLTILKAEHVPYEESNTSPETKALMEAFSFFGRLHRHHSPISGLRPSEFWVLVIVHRELERGSSGVMVSGIAKRLDIATPTATQFVKKLAAEGYVERMRSEKDKRIVHVVLTNKGSEVLKKSRKDFHAFFSSLAEHLGKDESLRLAELLTKATEFLRSRYVHH